MTDARAAGSDDGDAALMLRVQADDGDAFGALYDRFSRQAYRLAYSVAHDAPGTEDIVQEAFLSAWRGRAGFRPESGTVGAWLMGIVRHRASDSRRRSGRLASRRSGAQHVADRPSAAGSVEDTVIERDEAARLRDTLARLPAAQRDVITLAYFGELSSSEIAQALSLPLGTVKGRMRLGLDKLRADANP